MFKQWMIRSLIAVSAALFLAGCATMSGAVQTRAAADFNCQEFDVAVQDVGGSAYRATCNGQQATYVCDRQCNGWGCGPVTCRREATR